MLQKDVFTISTMYGCHVHVMIGNDPLKLVGKLRKKNRDGWMGEALRTQDNRCCSVCYDISSGKPDFSMMLMYINGFDDTPQFHSAVAHEIYHVANNIARQAGLLDDGHGNEHMAYLIGEITMKFYMNAMGWRLAPLKI